MAWIVGARNAVTQSNPAGLRSWSMRACVIMPRSATRTTRPSLKRSFQLADRCRQRTGIAQIAFEHLDRHRAATGRLPDLPSRL
jgi:hypothetical protein